MAKGSGPSGCDRGREGAVQREAAAGLGRALGLGWSRGVGVSLPGGLAARDSRAPVFRPGKEHEMQARGCVRAGVCEGVSEGVTEAPTCPARRRCGRRPAAGERGRLRAPRGKGARSSGWAPHLPAPPLLDAEAAAAAQPRPPCAPGWAGRGGTDRASPLRSKTERIPPSSAPLPSQPPLTHPTQRTGTSCPPCAFVSKRITIEMVLPHTLQCSLRVTDGTRRSG